MSFGYVNLCVVSIREIIAISLTMAKRTDFVDRAAPVEGPDTKGCDPEYQRTFYRSRPIYEVSSFSHGISVRSLKRSKLRHLYINKATCLSLRGFSTDSGTYGSHSSGHSVGPLVLTLYIDKYTGLHQERAYTYSGISCPECVHQFFCCLLMHNMHFYF